jgi:hypothetical protein
MNSACVTRSKQLLQMKTQQTERRAQRSTRRRLTPARGGLNNSATNCDAARAAAAACLVLFFPWKIIKRFRGGKVAPVNNGERMGSWKSGEESGFEEG